MATSADLQRSRRHLLAAIAAAVAGMLAAPAGNAADLSSERTYMPDYCSNRDVNCVVPDGPPPPLRGGAAAPLSGSSASGNPGSAASGISGSSNTGAGTGTGGVLTVPAVPTALGQVPSLPAQVPSLPAQVPTLSGQPPALPAQVPSTTSGGGAPNIAPNPNTARTLGRSSGGASGTFGTGASGTSTGGGVSGGGGTNAGGGTGAGSGASRR